MNARNGILNTITPAATIAANMILFWFPFHLNSLILNDIKGRVLIISKLYTRTAVIWTNGEWKNVNHALQVHNVFVIITRVIMPIADAGIGNPKKSSEELEMLKRASLSAPATGNNKARNGNNDDSKL